MRSSKSSLLHYSILSVLALTVSIVILRHAPDLNTAFDDPGRSKFRQTLGDVDNFDYNQANAVVNHLSSSEAVTHEHGNNHKVSYVTSFWAQMKDERITSHRREVVAALLANIHNPHFDEIVVFLDRQHGTDSSCLDVHSSMERRSQQIYGMSAEASNVLLNNKFKCIEMQTGQPTYYQMFQNALSEVVTGDVVVLSNGDIAFDDTMSLARYLNPEVLAVLGTHGFSDKMPTNIKHIYEEIMGRNPGIFSVRRKSRSDLWDANRCERTPLSWDTYIFHKSKLLGRLKEEDFKRLNQNHENVHFYMNENGAENAALWALQQSYPFSSTYNACDRIHSWHFHSAPKMHKARDVLWLGNREQVPKPWGEYARKDADCVDTDSCFYVNYKVSYVTSFWAKKRGECKICSGALGESCTKEP